MAQIISSIIGKRLSLGNEEYGRKMSFGSDWGKVRIGVRFGIYRNPASTSITTANLVIGLSEGTDLMYKSPSCRDFIGFFFSNPIPDATFTAASSPPQLYYAMGNPDGYFVSRVNGVTSSLTTGGPAFAIGGDPAAYLTPIFIDVLKNSPTSVTVSIRRNTSFISSTQEQFMKGMEDEVNYAGLGTTTNTGTLAYAGNSRWDSVCISWNKSAPNQMNIAEIGVVRFQ